MFKHNGVESILNEEKPSWTEENTVVETVDTLVLPNLI